MNNLQNSKSFRHFAKYLFLAGKVYSERSRTKEDLRNQLEKMKKSIIRMNLSYTDIDRLKEKIDISISYERKYAKFFRPPDNENLKLKNEIADLEQELGNEREEKLKIISENDEKIKGLSESLENIKNKMKHLLLEKAKRQHRLRILEQRIDNNIDTKNYYSS